MQRKESENRMVVNFLGKSLRDNPNLLSNLRLIEGYILLSHSDQKNPISLSQISKRLGISISQASNLFRKNMKQLWLNSSVEMQEAYPLQDVFKSVKTSVEFTVWNNPELAKEVRTKMSQAKIKSWENPEYRRKMIESRHKEWARPTRGKRKSDDDKLFSLIEEERDTLPDYTGVIKSDYRIDEIDQELWYYAKENNLISTIIKKGFLSESDKETLEQYFSHNGMRDNIDSLLNRLSIAIARLS